MGRHRKNHKEKVAQFKRTLQENRRLEKKRKEDFIEKMKKEYIEQQQQQNVDNTRIDQELITELDEFKLD
jgi:hypothetical protein